MSENDWTPGPWHFWKRKRDGRWFGPHPQMVGAIWGDRDSPLVEANGRLAAASPELYEALKLLTDQLEFNGLSDLPAYKQEYAIALAALAKARDGSELETELSNEKVPSWGIDGRVKRPDAA